MPVGAGQSPAGVQAVWKYDQRPSWLWKLRMKGDRSIVARLAGAADSQWAECPATAGPMHAVRKLMDLTRYYLASDVIAAQRSRRAAKSAHLFNAAVQLRMTVSAGRVG